MKINNVTVTGQDVAEQFASFFENKVTRIVSETVINQNVYNGTNKMAAESAMFMTDNKISECIKDLKLKNTEGYDRIPQRILIDGHDFLIVPLTRL